MPVWYAVTDVVGAVADGRREEHRKGSEGMRAKEVRTEEMGAEEACLGGYFLQRLYFGTVFELGQRNSAGCGKSLLV